MFNTKLSGMVKEKEENVNRAKKNIKKINYIDIA